MNRRHLLRSVFLAAACAPQGFRLALANAVDFRGKFLVSVQADGGWDPTSFCDPKANTPGEPVINHWAEQDEIRKAGNIQYAPFAGNHAFFEKYYSRMLVINGVDAQTNAHTAGIVHNWSGRISEGNPTTTALYSARHAADLPVGYLSFGGYSHTGGLVRFARLTAPDNLKNIATPELNLRGVRYFTEAEWELLESKRAATAEILTSVANQMPRAARNRRYYASSLASLEGLSDFANAIPPEDQLEQPEYKPPETFARSTLRRQAQLTVLAFSTGVAVSADLWLGGFDTHANHDVDHAWDLENLTGAIDYLWDYAEEYGLADRIVVVVGSDFGRTNFYNAQDGKDHWPIGSFVIMEKNQPWTNRAVGETDDLHFAHRTNPTTLERDDTDGTIIYPKHVHKALRRYLGIETTPGAQRFPFKNTEDFAFFG